MVLLTVTAATKAALDAYLRLDTVPPETAKRLSTVGIGSPVAHQDLVDMSQRLVRSARQDGSLAKEWRLDTLLRGAVVYQPPPPPKPEPTPEYKALMQRLRREEEQRQYDQILHRPAPRETFQQRFPDAAPSLGLGTAEAMDEVSYEDVKRQMILIINVLVSIICCSIAIWVAARRWSVPQRLGLSFSGSTVVAVAEVAIYMGYLRRIKEAKVLENKKAEKKEIIDTWVIDGTSTSKHTAASDSVRFRKGKHR